MDKISENFFVFDLCLFVCLEFIVPLENFSLIWRRHLCRWRAANFNLCSAVMAIEQWGLLNVPHPPRHGPTVVISEDPWHSHLLSSVWQWSCHYLFLRLRSVATGDRTSISLMRGERSTSTPPRRSLYLRYYVYYIDIFLYKLCLDFAGDFRGESNWYCIYMYISRQKCDFSRKWKWCTWNNERTKKFHSFLSCFR